MSEEGNWLSRFSSAQLHLNTEANKWMAANADFLLHSDFSKQGRWDIPTGHFSNFVPHHKRFQDGILPKEQRVTEARRLAREEKFQHLAVAKETKIIDREIRLLKDNLGSNRLLQRMQLASVEDAPSLEKRRNKLRQITQNHIHLGKFCHNLPDFSSSDGCFDRSRSPLEIKPQEKIHESITENKPEDIKEVDDKTSSMQSFNSIFDDIQKMTAQSNKRSKIKDKPVIGLINTRQIEIKAVKSEAKVKKKRKNKGDSSRRQSYRKEITDEDLASFHKRSFMNLKRIYWAKWKQYVRANKRQTTEESKWQAKIDNFLTCLNDYSSQKSNEQAVAAEKKYRRKTAPLIRERGDQQGSFEDLKKISDAIDESTANTRQILRAKSVQRLEPSLRGRARLIRIMTTTMDNDVDETQSTITFPQAPILVEMNKKHEDRKQRLQEILEKKRLLDEEKDRIVKEKYERQLIEAEQEKKQKLEAFREKLRKQRIAQEKQRLEWARMQRLSSEAEHFYRRKMLTKYGFSPWLNLVELRRRQDSLAQTQDDRRVQRKYLLEWRYRIEEIQLAKQQMVEKIWNKMAVRNMFEQWRGTCNERKLLNQVADDWYDQLLLKQAFSCWQDDVTYEHYYRKMKWKEALAHHKKAEQTRYLKQWMLLPQVMYLEREKESRRQQLRSKVQQVLPDYTPTPSSNTMRYYKGKV